MKKSLFFLLLVLTVCLLSRAAQDLPSSNNGLQTAQDSKAITPIPNNRVHRAGLLWMNTTNMGIFGNPDNFDDPCTGQAAVSGEMPGGSNTDYIFVGSLMFGGYLDSTEVDISGTTAKIFQGPLVSTAFEGWSGNPMPKEMWPINFNDDPSGTTLGQMYETSNVEGMVSCLFEDVYDPSATAQEQFSTMYTDKYVDRTYTGMDDYDNREHIPLGIEVRQKSYAWSYKYAQKFIIVDYTLYNRNSDSKDIYDFFMGMYLDCDIGMSLDWAITFADDISGFIQKWDGYIDPATGEQKTIDLNLAWAADNDGRDYTGGSYSGSPLNGATGVITVKVLKNPNPSLRYAYNMYIASSGDESLDWGPHWKTGLHSDWAYDLTPSQLGYDDNNQNNLMNVSGQSLAGGRVEGRPAGDKGKYMVMSNDEFDYNQYDIITVDNGTFEDPPNTLPQYAQADKWQKWLDPSEALPSPQDVWDGSLEDRNNIANGADSKYILSFGPLGTESNTNVAIDPNGDGLVDDYTNKTVWKFAYGDSLKLTMAFIVNENFNTDLDQDPNYSVADEGARFPETGIDPSLYDKGWYDALYNVVWCERMYDIPMYDTYVTKNGETKGDGWYGEDVGVDGIFAAGGTNECWWTDPMTEYGGPDDGEGNFELDDFTSQLTDIYGNSATGEDDLLPFGKEVADGEFGSTADGYGYMVKYDKSDGDYPIGTWVRYGFDNNRIDVGDGVPDFAGPPPPPSPKIEVYFDNNDVVVEWASKEFYELQDGTESYFGPEFFVDPFSRVPDFESYTIKVSPNSSISNFVDLLTIDKVNYAYQNVADIRDFLDVPISSDDILAHPENYPPMITAEGKFFELIPYGDNRSLVENHSVPNVFEYIATPISRVINETETVNYYQYSLRLYNKYLDNIGYVGVVASDHGDPKTGTPATTSSLYTNVKKIKGSEEGEVLLPIVTELYQNYPNPFNPETKINFSLNKDSNVKLTIYNVAGQMVRKVIDEELIAG